MVLFYYFVRICSFCCILSSSLATTTIANTTAVTVPNSDGDGLSKATPEAALLLTGPRRKEARTPSSSSSSSSSSTRNLLKLGTGVERKTRIKEAAATVKDEGKNLIQAAVREEINDAVSLSINTKLSKSHNKDTIMEEDELPQFRHCTVVTEHDDAGQPILTPPLRLDKVLAKNMDDDGQQPLLKSLVKFWIPGYPGSGSELLITLIKGLTGMNAGNSLYPEHCESSNTITCKTHYPAFGNPEGTYTSMPLSSDDDDDEGVTFSDQMFILLRNPMHALPSYCNYIMEWKSGLESHTTQASLDQWREWRDRQCNSGVEAWTNVIKYWIDPSNDVPYIPTLYIPFEELIDASKGPKLLEEMAEKFGMAQLERIRTKAGSMTFNHTLDDLLDREAIPCLWKSLVRDHPLKKRVSSYSPGYTHDNKSMMLKQMNSLTSWIGEESSLASSSPDDDNVEIMGGPKMKARLMDVITKYHEDIEHNMLMDDRMRKRK